MACFNSSPFSEQILFIDIVDEMIDPKTHKLDNLENVFSEEHRHLQSLFKRSKLILNSFEGTIIQEKHNQGKKLDKRDKMFTKIIAAKQSLDELRIKKNSLRVDKREMISKYELSDMLEKVLDAEKEQLFTENELKIKTKVLIGQMCFYKDYLNIYLDIAQDNTYILYFKKCRREENIKPQERIQFKTDDFKKFLNVCSRGMTNIELLNNMKSEVYNKHFRELIIEARESCLKL